ncbi:MAG: glycosyltransferase [Candidatus Aminicenantes bacterium]|nr:glycosyltransferase [Candidatus Aminicenantes bacterium]
MRNLILSRPVQESSIDLEVVTLYGLGTSGRGAEGLGVPIHNLDLKSKYSPAGLWRLVRFIRSRRYDVIHVHLFPASYFAALSSFFVRARAWVYTESSSWNRRRRYPSLRPLESLVFSRFKAVIAVSRLVAENLIDWLPTTRKKVRVIPNGVPIARLAGTRAASGRAPVILFVGRLEWMKGVDILLRALAGMRKTDVRLQVVGDGTLRQSLENLAAELGIGERTEFLGLRSEVGPLMDRADCLALPSRWEGLPMVVLEAMSRGLPVVASSVGGVPEIITQGVSGWLVPPEDSEAMAATLASVLTNPALRRQVGRNARERIRQDFSIERMAQKTVALYAEIIAGPAARRRAQ